MGEGNFSCGTFIHLGSPRKLHTQCLSSLLSDKNFKSTFCLVKKEETLDLFFSRIGKTIKK